MHEIYTPLETFGLIMAFALAVIFILFLIDKLDKRTSKRNKVITDQKKMIKELTERIELVEQAAKDIEKLRLIHREKNEALMVRLVKENPEDCIYISDLGAVVYAPVRHKAQLLDN